MNKLPLACLAIAMSAHAQTVPKVAFVGDQFTYVWQQSAAFKANPNWIGTAIEHEFGYAASEGVAAAFPAVLNQHPDYVFLETGRSDLAEGNSPAAKVGLQFEDAAIGIIDIVQMAKKANVKIIIANIGDPFTDTWLQAFAQNENVPIVNFGDALNKACIYAQGPCSVYAVDLSPENGNPFSIQVPNDAGFKIITQLAQTAIETYSLKIKSGYLSDLETFAGYLGFDTLPNPPTNQNSVSPGATLQFTPQATWTDGVTRPMTNVPYGGVLGTWSSSNPKVVGIDEHGFASAYTPGTATIHFTSATGQVFSPWGMTVVQWYAGEFNIPGPVY
jgi:Bacterial Ig-like domain (group 2)